MNAAAYFGASGADLAGILAARAPVASPYPRASERLAAVLESITALPIEDQNKLRAAFQAVMPKPTQKRIGGMTFRGWADFTAALRTARLKAAGKGGDRWYLNPDLALYARVPSAWVSCKVVGRTSQSRRDLKFPRAQFWPGGVLPTGPEYADYPKLDPTGDIRTEESRRASGRVVAMRRTFPKMAFALEPSPDGEMDTSRWAAD